MSLLLNINNNMNQNNSIKKKEEEFRVNEVISFPYGNFTEVGIITKVCKKIYLVDILVKQYHVVEENEDMRIIDYSSYWPLQRSGAKARVNKMWNRLEKIDPTIQNVYPTPRKELIMRIDWEEFLENIIDIDA